VKISDEMVNKALDVLIDWGNLNIDTSIESDTAAVRAALEAAVGDMVRDAERYRWLRDSASRIEWNGCCTYSPGYTAHDADAMGSAIDAALLAAANGEGANDG